MKKVISLILVLALVMGLSVTAFAAENPTTVEKEDSVTIDVAGIYKAGGSAAEVISVNVAWESMSFTYTTGSAGTWNPKTHSYDGTTKSGWSNNTSTITVTNHSNVAVTATLSYTQVVDTVTGSFDKTELNLESADQDKYKTADSEGNYPAPSANATFTIGGSISASSDKLGTITVSINKQG